MYHSIADASSNSSSSKPANLQVRHHPAAKLGYVQIQTHALPNNNTADLCQDNANKTAVTHVDKLPSSSATGKENSAQHNKT
jgi:hypothetical protein